MYIHVSVLSVLVDSFAFKRLEATVVMDWCYINKTELN